MRTQQEGGRLKAQERGLWWNQTCKDLDFGLLISRSELWEINFCYLSISVCTTALAHENRCFYQVSFSSFTTPSLKRRPEHLPFRVYVRDRHNPGLEQILITGAGGLIINGRNHCPAPHPGFLASSWYQGFFPLPSFFLFFTFKSFSNRVAKNSWGQRRWVLHVFNKQWNIFFWVILFILLIF